MASRMYFGQEITTQEKKYKTAKGVEGGPLSDQFTNFALISRSSLSSRAGNFHLIEPATTYASQR
jgi:hypothetical protein